MITMSYRIEGGDFDAAGLPRAMLKEQLARIGVGAQVMRRAMIASYEAEMNVVIHARTGTLWARLDEGKLDLEIADEGPGIPDVDLALREGWSTASAQAREMGFGAGMGLPNIRRNSDLFDIETRVGRGTRIRSTILLAAARRRRRTATSAGDAWPRSPRRGRDAAPACAASSPVPRPRCGFTTAGLSCSAELCIGCTACATECSAFGVRHPRSRAGPRPPWRAIARDAVLVAPRGFFSGFPVENSPAARVRRAARDRLHRDQACRGVGGSAARRGARVGGNGCAPAPDHSAAVSCGGRARGEQVSLPDSQPRSVALAAGGGGGRVPAAPRGAGFRLPRAVRGMQRRQPHRTG